MRKKILVLFAALFVWSWLLPSSAISGPSVYQVKRNVEALWTPLKESVPHVTAAEFKKIMNSGEEFILVDVRQAAEYNAGHIPGAINIDRGMLEWETPDRIQDTDAPIYVYCLTGIRSLFAAKRLTEMGYTNVTNIADSIEGWRRAGYPVSNRHGESVVNHGGFEKKE